MDMTKSQTPIPHAIRLLSLLAIFALSSGSTCEVGPNADQTCEQRLAGRYKVAGTIDIVTDTTQDFSDPGYFIAQTNIDTRFHIVLDLQTPEGAVVTDGKAPLKGIATITWSYHANNVNRTECSPDNPVIQYRDYDDRTWVADITATLTCTNHLLTKGFISGSATPDGTQLGQFYHITENCTSFTRDAEDDTRAAWNGFGPFEIVADEQAGPQTIGVVNIRSDVILPDGINGDKYVEARLTVTRQ